MKIYIYIIIPFILLSCGSREINIDECKEPINGKAVLVAYKVAKHSHLWLLNPQTNKLYDISGLGGRREPSILLGDTIDVYYCSGEIIFNKYQYIKEPFNRQRRIITINGFEYLK